MGQLPPVGDTPLWAENVPSAPIAMAGAMAFAQFSTVVFLDRIIRQSGDEDFKDALTGLRNAESTENEYGLFSTRFQTHLTLAQRQPFEDAVHLYPTKRQVSELNMTRLRVLQSSFSQQSDRPHSGGT